ncbi:hypothetical protein Barb6_02526 [Bacteroidales bacterium Barb6]|nr:hypothetical protein Barb6_02526 [Bacteroidales bacterium Barb6]
MRSKIFTQQMYSSIEECVIQTINSSYNIVNDNSLKSPRAVGDAIQQLLEERFSSFLPQKLLKEYNSAFARRAMADFAFQDNDGFCYVVDNKTHNMETAFNMPNLTSVERLSRFYEDYHNYFTLLIVAYETSKSRINANYCHFLPIEHLSWSCLTIGALGWGQIQIANSNNIIIDRAQTRKSWMLSLCDRLAEFYPKEIAKIHSRISHFEKIKEYWLQQEDYSVLLN